MAGKVVGMNVAVGGPACEFLLGLAEIAEELLVEAFDFATRPEVRDEAWNVSTIRRDWPSLSRSASSARFRSSIRC